MFSVPVFPQTIPSQACSQDGNTWNPLLLVRTLYRSKEWDCSFRLRIHRRLPMKSCFWILSGLFGGTSSSHPPMRYNSCSACWRLYPWMEVWTGPSALIDSFVFSCIQKIFALASFVISWKQGKPSFGSIVTDSDCSSRVHEKRSNIIISDLNISAATRGVKKVPWSCQAGTSGLI